MKFDKNRPGDDEEGPDLVEAHTNLEAALEHVLGIKDSQRISQSIFGTVDADGSITLIRFSNSNVQTEPQKATGFEWNDGSQRRRFLMVGSGLKCYSWSGSAWVLEFDFEDVDEPALVDKIDVSITAAEMLAEAEAADDEGRARKILGVGNSVNMGVILRPAHLLQDGAKNFIELGDVKKDAFGEENDPFADSVGSYIIVGEDSELAPSAPEGSRECYVMLDSPPVEIPADTVNTPVGPWTMRNSSIANGITLTERPLFRYDHGIMFPRGVYRMTVRCTLSAADSVNAKIMAYFDCNKPLQLFPKRLGSSAAVAETPFGIYQDTFQEIAYNPYQVFGDSGSPRWSEQSYLVVSNGESPALELALLINTGKSGADDPIDAYTARFQAEIVRIN